MSSQKTHLLYIDSLRAIAAIYVVMHHALLQYYRASLLNLTGIKKISLEFFAYGHFSVDLFIVLSGFSLMLSVTKNEYNLKGGSFIFFKRRVIRIIPPYYFAMLFSMLLIWLLIGKSTGTHWDVSIPFTINDVIKHVLLIHDFFKSGVNHINHVFWSIAVEFRIYLFFPFLVWLWRKFGPFTTLFVSLLISIAGSFLLLFLVHENPNLTSEGVGVSPYIILFVFGMVAADISFSSNKIATITRKIYLDASLIKTFFFLVVCSVFFVVVHHLLGFIIDFKKSELNISQMFIDVSIGFFSAIFLIFVSISVNYSDKYFKPIGVLSSQPLIFIGTFSYSLYLIHAPLLQVISQYILTPFHFSSYLACWLLIIVGTPITIVVSYFFFYLFERPFINMGKTKNRRVIENAVIENPAP